MKNRKLIRCLVLDDEYLSVRLISGYIERTEGLQLIMKTTSMKEALDAVQNGMADVIFLDVQMPEGTGIEFIKSIRNAAKVIFTTAFAQYALEGYEHDIIDYLLKPVTFERFQVAVKRAHERLNIPTADEAPAANCVFVRTEHRIQRLDYSSILYIEGLRDYIAFHTPEGKILSLTRMKHMEAVLPDSLFVRIHKSYLVNISKVNCLEKGAIRIENTLLPIGETYKEAILARMGF